MELKKKQYKGEKIELEGIFTLTETEPTEIEEDTLFLSFGSPDPESFYDYLIAKHFYDYEDIKTCDFEPSAYEDVNDGEEETIIYELQDDADES